MSHAIIIFQFKRFITGLMKCQDVMYFRFTHSNAFHFRSSHRGCVTRTRKGSREPLVTFWLITRAFCYRHTTYQIIQAIYQYQNIDIHTSMCRYVLLIRTSKHQNTSEKGNVACYCQPLVNKFAVRPWFSL